MGLGRFRPIDGQTAPVTVNPTWLKVRVLQHVVVDLQLLEAMGRVIPLTLLQPGYGARAVRRTPKALASIEAVVAAA
jgi:hypothetical protein